MVIPYMQTLSAFPLYKAGVSRILLHTFYKNIASLLDFQQCEVTHWTTVATTGMTVKRQNEDCTPLAMGVRRNLPREGPLGDFSKILLGGPKVVKFIFSHSKLRKQPFFDIFQNPRGPRPPLPPSHAHVFDLTHPLRHVCSFTVPFRPLLSPGFISSLPSVQSTRPSQNLVTTDMQMNGGHPLNPKTILASQTLTAMERGVKWPVTCFAAFATWLWLAIDQKITP